MAENQDQDRSEKATPFKLREAKRKGQVAKSLEVNSWLVMFIGLVIVYVAGKSMIMKQANLSRAIFTQAGSVDLVGTHSITLFISLVRSLAETFWPLFAGLMVISILANIAQTGPVFSFFPIKPDIKRLNPISGFKRVFSKKTLFDAVKTVIKLVIFSVVIYLVLSASVSATLSLLDTSPKVYFAFLLDSGTSIALKLLLVFLFIALLDLIYSRWDFAKKMRMSRRDLKEEVKRREGDPQIKSKIRELQREAAKRSGSLSRVPDADVLITNPTHFAVALRYERGVSPAPQVIAKGAGELAFKMRVTARKHSIPVVENKKLARKLFKAVDINNYIPEELYPAVARVLVWIYALRRRDGIAPAMSNVNGN